MQNETDLIESLLRRAGPRSEPASPTRSVPAATPLR